MIPLVSHWVKIVAFDPLHRDERIVLRWQNMTLDQRTKWDWYFKYRSALMQVQHPRWEVEFTWGSEEATGKTYEQLRAQRIAIQKGKITRWENKAKELKSIIERMEDEHNELWPITENPEYQLLMNQMGIIEIEFLDDLLALQRMRPVVTSAINRYTASGRIRRDSAMNDLINKRLDQLITDLKALK